MKFALLGKMALVGVLTFAACGDDSSSNAHNEGHSSSDSAQGYEIPCDARNEGLIIKPVDSDNPRLCTSGEWIEIRSSSSKAAKSSSSKGISSSVQKSSSSSEKVNSSSSKDISSSSKKSSSSSVKSNAKSSCSSSKNISSSAKESSSSLRSSSSSVVQSSSALLLSSSSKETSFSSSSEGEKMFLCDDGVTYVLDLANCSMSSSSVVPASSTETLPSSSSKVQSSSGKSSSSSEKSSSSVVVKISYGFLTDTRDKQTYKTVTIGKQTWMAQNLNYATKKSSCYNNDSTYCAKYGRLYYWSEAMDSLGTWSKNGKGCGLVTGVNCTPTYPVRGICPSGYHLPSGAEYETLYTTVGGVWYSDGGIVSEVAKKLKSASGWSDGGNGSDDYGFSVLPAGKKRRSTFENEGSSTYFWTSVQNGDYAFIRNFHEGGISVDGKYEDLRNAVSVRCVMDDPADPNSSSSHALESSGSNIINPGAGSEYDEKTNTLKDLRDNKTYRTVVIGDQIWMAQNLNYASANSLCYNNLAQNCDKYGRYYPWAAAIDISENECGYGNKCSLPSGNVRGICPAGWHLPSKAEFDSLFSAAGGAPIAAKMLKSTSGWAENANGIDFYSFSILPASNSTETGWFDKDGYWTYLWSSTDVDEVMGNDGYSAIAMFMSTNIGEATLMLVAKYYGNSVRCVKDEYLKRPSYPIEDRSIYDGEKRTLTDLRDGNVYRTAVIGPQIWMAQNLKYKTANSFCYNNDSTNCAYYGRLYRWSAAMDSVGLWSENGKGCGYKDTCTPTYSVRGACPLGWHLPTTDEYQTLVKTAAGQNVAGKLLKSATGWLEGGSGRDSYLFTALPSGYGDGPFYRNKGYSGHFWTSIESDSTYASVFGFFNTGDNARVNKTFKNYTYPIRCIKD